MYLRQQLIGGGLNIEKDKKGLKITHNERKEYCEELFKKDDLIYFVKYILQQNMNP